MDWKRPRERGTLPVCDDLGGPAGRVERGTSQVQVLEAVGNVGAYRHGQRGWIRVALREKPGYGVFDRLSLVVRVEDPILQMEHIAAEVIEDVPSAIHVVNLFKFVLVGGRSQQVKLPVHTPVLVFPCFTEHRRHSSRTFAGRWRSKAGLGTAFGYWPYRKRFSNSKNSL
jgi:hypothetical protein